MSTASTLISPARWVALLPTDKPMVTVAGTKGDDSIAVDANGAAVDVSGLAALVRVTHADPSRDTLVIDPVTGIDNVAIDPAVNALIQASVL